MSLFAFVVEERIAKESRLLKVAKLIDWSRIERHLKGFHKNQIFDQGGQRPYDPLKMFKAILLGQWHSLSDPALEESLMVRLDFMLFTGFDLTEKLPDETTLCRYRNRLIEKKLHKKLLNEINRQLEKMGVKVERAEGAVIDATIIESASRPNRTLECSDPEEEEEDAKIKESADPDARWLKKGKSYHFGYRGYIRTDEKEGYIESVEVRPANESETKMLMRMTEGSRAKRIYADKGFASKENRNALKEKGFKDGIMEKAVRGKKLSILQKLKNRLISGKRFVVERSFGTLKRQFKLTRASYRECWRVEGQMTLKAMSYNLLKAARAVEIS
jgi:IS5 family transposase